MRRIATLFAIPLLLSACAKDDGQYPSLARRPIERTATESPAPLPAPTPAPPSAELLARIESLVAQARAADAAFRDHTARTRALVGAAAGSAVASESWAVATVALSDLESSRSDAMVALAELDALYAARTVAGEEVRAVKAARATVIELVGGQDSVLADLRSRMAS